MTGGGTLPFIVLAPGVLVSDSKADTYGQRGASAAGVGLTSDI